MSLWKDFTNGLVRENPVFRLVLGLCPVLAVTTALMNGFWMGVAVLFVLTCSNVIISLLRNFIPGPIRIPCFIVVIATFVTIVQLTMNAYLPAMYDILGIFVPLIVVNCIILARAEAFASKRGVLSAAADGLGMGIGFTVALMILGGVREFLGTGDLVFNGRALLGRVWFEPAVVMIMPPGAFIAMGLVLALLNALGNRGKSRAKTR
ncbi:MAG TPA: electron transport complex subunit RsxE [Clostridiales bacterium UBA8153]|nr:electron transport complex subunit RsxE [Clostridiales bacterium UBA8153]